MRAFRCISARPDFPRKTIIWEFSGLIRSNSLSIVHQIVRCLSHIGELQRESPRCSAENHRQFGELRSPLYPHLLSLRLYASKSVRNYSIIRMKSRSHADKSCCGEGNAGSWDSGRIIDVKGSAVRSLLRDRLRARDT